jgi:cellobiose-specific phosphotransferase system component IIB
MIITKKLERAARLKREMDCAIETLVKRDGSTRATAVDKVILSPEVSRAHRQEREETELE